MARRGVSRLPHEHALSAKYKLLIYIALAAAMAYVVAAVLADGQRVSSALRALGIVGIGLVLGLSCLNYLLRFQRWQYYLGVFGHRLPRLRHLVYYLSGFAFTVSPGKAGEAIRSVHFRAHGVPYSQSVAAVFVERLLDLLAMAVLASLIVIQHRAYWPLIAGVLTIAVALFVMVCRAGTPLTLQAIGKRSSGRIGMIARALAQLLIASRRLLHVRPLAIGLLVAILAWGAEGVGFYIICRALDLHIDSVAATGIYATAVLAGSAAFFLPAGIGGMEATMTSLLTEQGMSVRVALVATLLCRLATLWFAVLLGAFATLLIELKNKAEVQRVIS